jgi:hypothetical protein
MDRATFAIAKDLNLDVARRGQVFFDIDLVIAERGLGFRPRGAKGRLQLFGVVRDLHAAPSTACRSLDDHRIADLRCDSDGGLVIRNAAL